MFLTIKSKNMTKFQKLTLPLAAFALVATGAIATYGYQSFAQNADPSQQEQIQQRNPIQNLVQAIAEKFNLNVSDVQQVFDDQHQQIETQHQQMLQNRLSQAVSEGKLTQEQADKLVTKMEDLHDSREANRDDFRSLTQEERQAQIDQQKQELEQWAQDNGIPTEFLPFGNFMGPGHGHNGWGGMM